jgi:hypothetical protein
MLLLALLVFYWLAESIKKILGNGAADTSVRYKIAQRLSHTNLTLPKGYLITFLALSGGCTAVLSGYPFGTVQKVPTQSTVQAFPTLYWCIKDIFLQLILLKLYEIIILNILYESKLLLAYLNLVLQDLDRTIFTEMFVNISWCLL